MGQQDIADLLLSRYPQWMAGGEISKCLGIAKNNIMRSLKSMSMREEIEFKIIIPIRPKTRWVKLYRVKRQ